MAARASVQAFTLGCAAGALVGGAATAWLLGVANPVWAGGSAIMGTLLLAAGMSLLQKGRSGRREAARHVAVVDRFQQRFLNAAAHELGPPLTPVVLQVRALRSELAQAPEPTRRRLDIVERNVGRLNRIVADLVKGAELSVVPEQPKHAQADLARTVRRAVDALAADLREAGIGVGVQVEGAADVAAPAGPLEYVVGNLLREAMQFRERGARIDLTIRRLGPEVELRLWSQGWKVRQAEWDPGLFLGEQGSQASLAIYLAAAMADRHGWTLAIGTEADAQAVLRVPAGESWRRSTSKA